MAELHQQQQRRRREKNRVSARRRYHLKQTSVQELREQEEELEQQYQRIREQIDNASSSLQEFETVRRGLLRESRALRKRREEFLRWQFRLHYLLNRTLPVESLPVASRPKAKQRYEEAVRLKIPMTVQECHAIAQRVYAEVHAFMETTSFVTTGSSVFGWTDRRVVDNKLLKFSLQKVFPMCTARDLVTRTWEVVTKPEKHKMLYSSSLNMRCEHVQTVDDSNIILYQEFHVKERHPTTSKELDSTIVMRSLVLNTLFETADGFVILFYGLDADRLVASPPQEDIDGMPIKYEWLSIYDWCAMEHVGPNGDQCKSSYVGAMPEEAAVNVYWAIEVLFMVLRMESHIIGPVLVLE